MTETDPHGGFRSKNKIDTATEVRQRITQTLARRTRPPGSVGARIENQLKRGATELWSRMKKRPFVGVLLVGGLGFAAASTIGVGEITFAVVVGYAAYQVLREGVPPGQAVQEVLGMERRG